VAAAPVRNVAKRWSLAVYGGGRGLCGEPESEMAVVGATEAGRRPAWTADLVPLSRCKDAIYGESWAPVQGSGGAPLPSFGSARSGRDPDRAPRWSARSLQRQDEQQQQPTLARTKGRSLPSHMPTNVLSLSDIPKFLER
jgi:hypothetical protein